MEVVEKEDVGWCHHRSGPLLFLLENGRLVQLGRGWKYGVS